MGEVGGCLAVGTVGGRQLSMVVVCGRRSVGVAMREMEENGRGREEKGGRCAATATSCWSATVHRRLLTS
jgi:hypothetical protein